MGCGNKHRGAECLSGWENLFLTISSLHSPGGAHGNRHQEGLILPSSVGEKNRTQDMSQTEGEAECRLQVGRLQGLEP